MTTVAIAAAEPPGRVHPVALRLNALIDEVAGMFPERRAALHAMACATLAREHFFMLGSPGTGKSALARTFFGAIDGARYFEQILSKNRPGEAILGPYDFKKMTEDKELVRNTVGYLPTAEFALLDEIGKMSPTTGHDLLAIINERLLHNGSQVERVPLSTLGASSNELPTADDNDDAAALWDRLLVRIVVVPIHETSNWISMLQGNITRPTNVIWWPELRDVIANVVPFVPISATVYTRLVLLKKAMLAKDLMVSDRRWRQSIKLIQAHAFLSGRSLAAVDDVQVLRHSLWEDPSQIEEVERLTIGFANSFAQKALDILRKADQIAEEVRGSKDLSSHRRSARARDLAGQLKACKAEVSILLGEASLQGGNTTKIAEVRDRIDAVLASVYTDLMGLDMDLLKRLGGLDPLT